MKVIRFHEKKVYQPASPPSEIAASGWTLESRHRWLCACSLTLGTLVGGTIAALAFLPSIPGWTQGWPFILWLITTTGFTFILQQQIVSRFFIAGLHRIFASLRRGALQRVPLSRESLQMDAGVEGLQVAESFNQLISFVRSETAPAPIQVYRESFLMGTQPSYICDFRAGRLLDCNHAFANFLGMEREALLMQRLGDITAGGEVAKPTEPGSPDRNSTDNSSVMEMHFRHVSGESLQAVTFFRAISDPHHPDNLLHCATVVPQRSSPSPTV